MKVVPVLGWIACAVGLVAGCATASRTAYNRHAIHRVLAAHPRSSKRIPPPHGLEPRPWQIGQWALYERRGGDDVGYVRIRVVAKDGCGTWFEQDVQQPDHRWTYLFCMRGVPRDRGEARDELRVVIVRLDHGAPRVVDLRSPGSQPAAARYAWLADLLIVSWEGHAELPRVDAAVPAGRYAGALELVQDGETVRWHPAVPFGGVVERRGGRSSLELLAQGQGDVPSVLPAIASALQRATAPRYPPRFFVDLGVGVGRLTGRPGPVTANERGLEVAYGLRVTPTLDVMAELRGLGLSSDPQDPTQANGADFVLAKLRWSPFRTPLPRHHVSAIGLEWGLYVEGGLGYGELDRTTDGAGAVLARGPALAVALGWLAPESNDVAFGIELSDRSTLFDAGQGVRHDLAASIYLQLHASLLR